MISQPLQLADEIDRDGAMKDIGTIQGAANPISGFTADIGEPFAVSAVRRIMVPLGRFGMLRARRYAISTAWSAAACWLLIGVAAWGQTQPRKATSSAVVAGKPLVVCAATAACGRWAQEHPFDAKSYGKVRGFSPATSAHPKVVIYTRSLDADFLRFAKAVDAVIAKHKQLEWSLVQAIDDKGAQYGGYSADELGRRLAEVRGLAERHGIQKLSFVISASNAKSLPQRLGLSEECSFLIANVARAGKPSKHPIVQWTCQDNASRLTDAAVARIISGLEESIAASEQFRKD